MASNEEIHRKCKVEECVFTRYDVAWLVNDLCMTSVSASVSASVSLYNFLK